MLKLAVVLFALMACAVDATPGYPSKSHSHIMAEIVNIPQWQDGNNKRT